MSLCFTMFYSRVFRVFRLVPSSSSGGAGRERAKAERPVTASEWIVSASFQAKCRVLGSQSNCQGTGASQHKVRNSWKMAADPAIGPEGHAF